jgi:hypothetical protein
LSLMYCMGGRLASIRIWLIGLDSGCLRFHVLKAQPLRSTIYELALSHCASFCTDSAIHILLRSTSISFQLDITPLSDFSDMPLLDPELSTFKDIFAQSEQHRHTIHLNPYSSLTDRRLNFLDKILYSLRTSPFRSF